MTTTIKAPVSVSATVRVVPPKDTKPKDPKKK